MTETHPLMAEGKVMIVPGVYDALSTKLAERAGSELPGPLAAEPDRGRYHAPGLGRGGGRTYAEIHRTGSSAGMRDDMMAFDEFNALVGLEERYADDERHRP